ncbi:MAG TPA: CPBP family intramembrane glutamate endopeptidase, partial [Burkholderiaceae bacterium]
MSLPFVLLALAIAAAWLPPLRVARRAFPTWMALFAAAVAAGVVDGVLRAPAVASLGMLCALAWMSR